MSNRIYQIVLLSFFTVSYTFSQNLTVSGTIKDAQTGETHIGANVFLVNTTEGVTSNTYGFYSLKIKPGKTIICFSFIGYHTQTDTLNIYESLVCNRSLQHNTTNLSEVTIFQNSHVTSTNVSKTNLNPIQIKRMPGMTGEPDLMKSLQFIPGVQTANEGSNNLNVRGGGNDQNLILLDEAPVYNASHALGFYSVFNTDAIKNVTFYKGGFPAQYGGRLSSVVDITMKDGNSEAFGVTGGVGLTTSRLTIEGPIKENKASFLISGRYSYVGDIANLLVGKLGREALNIWPLRNFSSKNEISFFDLNAKFNYTVNKRNKIYASAYSGGDHFLSVALINNNVMDWGNTTSTIRWNHIYNSSIFSNTTLYYSKYRYSYKIEEDARNFIWKSNIMEGGIKHDMTFYVNTQNTTKTGASLIYHKFSPGTLEPNGTESATKPMSLESRNTVEASLYVSNENKINDRLSLIYGLRYTAFALLVLVRFFITIHL